MNGSPEQDPFPQADASPATEQRSSAYAHQSPEDWEQVRRSIAMLKPGSWAMKREQALTALDSLVRTLRWRDEQTDR